MTYYEWKHSTPRVRHGTGERIDQGDIFEPTPHEKRCWPDRMTAVCGAETSDGGRCRHPAGACPIEDHDT